MNQYKLGWRLALAMLLLATLRVNGNATEIFMSPNGNDRWSGRFDAPNPSKTDGPLATMEEAKSRVRQLLKAGTNTPITVLIRGGEYPLQETVVFTPQASGTKECPVSYQAFKGERPVFSGGIKLSDWKKVTAYPRGTANKVKDDLWYCTLPSDWKVTSLYNGTEMLKRARSSVFRASEKQPDDGWNDQPKKMNLKKLGYKSGQQISFRREIHFSGTDIREWENLTDIEILISPSNGWLVNYLPLKSIDTAKKFATYGIDSTYTVLPGNEYVVENAIDYLDEPGEWVFHGGDKRIYLYSTSDPTKMDIRAPKLQEFIRIQGAGDAKPVQFLRFQGITFRHGLRDTWKDGDQGLQHDWEMYDKGNAVLRFRHAEDCVVEGCTFVASSGTGVRLDLHCQRITVKDSIFAHLGGTGILLSGYAPGTKDENKHNHIVNNYLHHIGTISTHSPAIFIAQSGHNLISHNTIHDLGYNGMVISGCRPGFFTLHSVIPNRREWVSSLRMDEIQAKLGKAITPTTQLTIEQLEPFLHARSNRIEYNEIFRVMLQLHDGNGIYFSGMGIGNVAHRNYVHDLGGDRGFIRLDDDSGATTITENVGINVRFMFVLKGPCEYRNNFAINARGFSNGIRTETHLEHNIFYADQRATPNLKKKGGGYVFDDIDRIANSLVFAPHTIDAKHKEQDMVPKERRGASAVGMLYSDPLFDEEAMKKKIFRFKPGSPAEKLGIKPIDLSAVGSTLVGKK